jgi:hypothetical protein
MRSIPDRAASTSKQGSERNALIDFDHLALMTLNDTALERDVLALFNQQAVAIVDRMRRANAAELKALAHTLRGSASGVGAFEIARQTEALEMTSLDSAVVRPAIVRLMETVRQTSLVIADRVAPPHSSSRSGSAG